MRYQPDDYDLERSYELEHRLDRDAEREPYGRRWRRRPVLKGTSAPIAPVVKEAA